MTHRIRAAGLIIKDDKILLVKHVHPHTGFVWWVPPGGGVEVSDRSIAACVEREVFEETGLCVDVSPDVRFVREFLDMTHDALNIELFFDAYVVSGHITMEHVAGNGADEDFIRDVKWCSLEEIQDLVVFPEVLKENFGRDRLQIYLGRQIG